MEDQKPNNHERTRSVLRGASRANNIFEAIKAGFGGTIMIILLLAGAVYFTILSSNLMVGALMLLMALAAGFTMWRTITLGKKKLDPPTSQTQTPFEGTGTIKTETPQPYPRTTLGENEHVIGWFGPLQRYDQAGMSSVGLMGTETHRGAENTLFVTDRQLIAVAFTQADFDTVQPEDSNRFAQSSAAFGRASGQHVQVSLMNYKQWPALVASIPATGYPSILDTHYQWGIPLTAIQLVEVKNTFTNAGVQIHLNDGTILKYSTFLKSQIEPFAQAAGTAGLQVQR